MRDLGLDWDRLRRDAKVGTDKDTIKNRWASDKSKRVRASLRAALDRAEAKRAERSTTGALIQMLEDWNEAGRVLSRKPELLSRELAKARLLAASVEQGETARRMLAEADAVQAATLLSPTPAPTGKRK